MFDSLALLADSGHMLSDSMALVVSMLAIRIGRRGPTDRHTFGLPEDGNTGNAFQRSRFMGNRGGNIPRGFPKIS